MWYIVPMDKDYTKLRVWKDTVNRLRLLAAHQRKSMIALVDQLSEEECRRLGIKLLPMKKAQEHD
jgi:hypothetical protein